ncbi:DUF3179 domain-containing (seleno)protein [Parvibaculaceae bacterium PLY_AMNH_Bact1]|nr:DUF3179 domain-containing (seleno)protein [Parvibaculaceae bacterium PLY_AMNH_Bact1]
MPRSIQQRLSQIAMGLTVSLALTAPWALTKANEPDDPQTATMAAQLLSQSPVLRRVSIEWLRDVGGKPAIPALIRGLRFAPDERELIIDALESLTEEKAGERWHDWVLWQEAHPEVPSFEGHDSFLTTLFTAIDPNFVSFVYPGVNHKIRLEEIVWGGVYKDGIPALTNPDLIEAADANYLTDEELVFGVSINGDVRAYPLRIMDWHEMFNDVIGGIPVSLAYCTLCASGILFNTRRPDGSNFVFGSSGFLYRSNKLMYDQQTQSLWNQFTGKPVVGRLTDSDIALKTLPVAITSWGDWKTDNPSTKVLGIETGYRRDYRPGKPYGDYFDSADLLFPAQVERTELDPKDYVFALRSSGVDKAWPLTSFENRQVINDVAGALTLTLIGDAKVRSVRAYRTDGTNFEKTDDPRQVVANGKTWAVTEEALINANGKSFPRLPGHIAYWFAWSGYLGDSGELADVSKD